MKTEDAKAFMIRLKGHFSKMTDEQVKYWADELLKFPVAAAANAIAKYIETRSEFDTPALWSALRSAKSATKVADAENSWDMWRRKYASLSGCSDFEVILKVQRLQFSLATNRDQRKCSASDRRKIEVDCRNALSAAGMDSSIVESWVSVVFETDEHFRYCVDQLPGQNQVYDREMVAA